MPRAIYYEGRGLGDTLVVPWSSLMSLTSLSEYLDKKDSESLPIGKQQDMTSFWGSAAASSSIQSPPLRRFGLLVWIDAWPNSGIRTVSGGWATSGCEHAMAWTPRNGVCNIWVCCFEQFGGGKKTWCQQWSDANKCRAWHCFAIFFLIHERRNLLHPLLCDFPFLP